MKTLILEYRFQNTNLLEKRESLKKLEKEKISNIDNKVRNTYQTTQTFQMMLPKADIVNVVKYGLRYEDSNDLENPKILS